MNRSTAAKRIKTHLRDYRERLVAGEPVLLDSYSDYHACPLCVVVRKSKQPACDGCLSWPTHRSGGCCGFIRHIDSLKTVRGKLALLDELEAELARWAELDRWAEEES